VRSTERFLPNKDWCRNASARTNGYDGVIRSELLLVVILWTAYCTLHSFLISVRFTDLMTRLLKKLLCLLQTFLCGNFIHTASSTHPVHGEFESPVIMTYDAPCQSPVCAYVRVVAAVFWAFFFDYDSFPFLEFARY